MTVHQPSKSMLPGRVSLGWAWGTTGGMLASIQFTTCASCAHLTLTQFKVLFRMIFSMAQLSQLQPSIAVFLLFFFFFFLFLWLCNSLRCYSLKPKKYGNFYEPLRHTVLWHTIVFSNLIGVLSAEWTMFCLTCAIFFNTNIKQTNKNVAGKWLI